MEIGGLWVGQVRPHAERDPQAFDIKDRPDLIDQVDFWRQQLDFTKACFSLLRDGQHQAPALVLLPYEDKLAAVWPPAGRRDEARAGRQLPLPPAVGVHHPDRRDSAVARRDERDHAAVWAEDRREVYAF